MQAPGITPIKKFGGSAQFIRSERRVIETRGRVAYLQTFPELDDALRPTREVSYQSELGFKHCEQRQRTHHRLGEPIACPPAALAIKMQPKANFQGVCCR